MRPAQQILQVTRERYNDCLLELGFRRNILSARADNPGRSTGFPRHARGTPCASFQAAFAPIDTHARGGARAWMNRSWPFHPLPARVTKRVVEREGGTTFMVVTGAYCQGIHRVPAPAVLRFLDSIGGEQNHFLDALVVRWRATSEGVRCTALAVAPPHRSLGSLPLAHAIGWWAPGSGDEEATAEGQRLAALAPAAEDPGTGASDSGRASQRRDNPPRKRARVEVLAPVEEKERLVKAQGAARIQRYRERTKRKRTARQSSSSSSSDGRAQQPAKHSPRKKAPRRDEVAPPAEGTSPPPYAA